MILPYHNSSHQDINSTEGEEDKLKELSMALNDITDDICDIIVDSLPTNNSLMYLYIHGNKISKEASQLILNCLRQNNTMEDLYLPSNYSEEDQKQIISLQDIVNEERVRRGCSYY